MVVSLVTGTIIGLTSYFIFQIPAVFSAVLALGGCIMFFFIILWSSYVFIFR